MTSSGGRRYREETENTTRTDLGVPVVGFFKLQVLPGFAAQIKPLPLQPFDHRFPQQGGRVDSRYEHHVLP